MASRAPQSDCVELKYERAHAAHLVRVAPQSDCVELKCNQQQRPGNGGQGLNRTVWN